VRLHLVLACVALTWNNHSGEDEKYSYGGSRAVLGRTRPTTQFFWDGVSGPADAPRCATDLDDSKQRYEVSDKVKIVRDIQKCPNKAKGWAQDLISAQKPPSDAIIMLLYGYRLALIGALNIVILVVATTICFRRDHSQPWCLSCARSYHQTLLGEEIFESPIV